MKHKVSPFNPPISGPRQPAPSQAKAPAISGPVAPPRPPQQVAAPTAPCYPVGPKIVAHVAMKPQPFPAAPPAPVMPPRPSQIIAPPKAMPVAPRIPIAPPSPNPGAALPGGIIKAQVSATGPDLGAIAAALEHSVELEKIEREDFLDEMRQELLPKLRFAMTFVKDYPEDDANVEALKAMTVLNCWEAIDAIFQRFYSRKFDFAKLFGGTAFSPVIQLLDAAHNTRHGVAHIVTVKLVLSVLLKIEAPFRELVQDVVNCLEKWIDELVHDDSKPFDEAMFWDFYSVHRKFQPQV